MAEAKYDEYRNALKRMKVGESFFVENQTPKDLYFLRQVARRAGVKIAIHKVTNDEIYQGQSGSRVWKEGLTDENDGL